MDSQSKGSGFVDDDDAELDRPLVGQRGRDNKEDNSTRNGGRVRIVHDSDDDEGNTHNNNNNTNNALRGAATSASPSAAAGHRSGTLTTTNNGAWNRLSCVSALYSSCVGGASTAANGGEGGSTCGSRGPIYHTAVDVACAVIDKLPTFFASKIGPSATKVEEPKRRFVTFFERALVVPYDKSNSAHVGLTKALWRQYYSVCCVDADPLVDVSAYFEGRAEEQRRAVGSPSNTTSTCTSQQNNNNGSNNNGDDVLAVDRSSANRVWGRPAPSSASAAPNKENTNEGGDDISSEFWKMIGFQGTNPGTDFRGGGVLSLLLLLHLFLNRPDLVRSIFRSRERAPRRSDNNDAPTATTTTTTTTTTGKTGLSSSDSSSSILLGTPQNNNNNNKGSSSSLREAPTDYFFPPPFFERELREHIITSGSLSTQHSGGDLYLTCEYPFAIAAINVAMHLMLLLGAEGNGHRKTCLATTEDTTTYSARLAKAKLLAVAYDDNGNCTAHDEPINSLRPFILQLLRDQNIISSVTAAAEERAGANPSSSRQTTAASASSKNTASAAALVVEGFDHFASVFEVAVAVMHNEWESLPPKERNILFFNQILKVSREKTELLLRHSENIVELGRTVNNYAWVAF